MSGFVIEKNGAFHLRTYSSVDISTGVPLKTAADGKRHRKQQSVLLVRKGDALCRLKSSPAVQRIAADRQEQITRWERLVASGEERPPDGNLTVSEFYYTVFLPYIKQAKEASTVKTYQRYWDAYLKDFFNHSKTLSNFQPYQGTNFLEACSKKYSVNTVNHIRSTASGIFAYGIAKGYIGSNSGSAREQGRFNPWHHVQITIPAQDVEEGHAYSQNEVELILEALERVTGREEYSAKIAGMVVAVCFYGGLRPSEAAALRWENVSLEGCAIRGCRQLESHIHVSEAYVAGHHKGTKTGKTRTVKMLSQLRHRLKLWSLHCPSKKGWLFPNQAGEAPINLNDLGARIIPNTLEKIGMEWYGFYGCRRGFGTLMVLSGASAEETCQAMGNSIDVVMRHYFKDQQSQLAESGINKLEAALNGATQARHLLGGTQ
jgi:integrase